MSPSAPSPASRSSSSLRAVMFDLDGTLIDTMFKFADLAAEVMGTHHEAEFSPARARYLETSGIPFAHQLEVIYPGHTGNSAASSEFERRKRDITRRTAMDEATIGGLKRLRELGLKLVVSSNTGQEFVDEFTAAESFAFDLALGFDDSRGLAKGAPHFKHAVAELDVSLKHVLFVGDSLKDAEIATEAGVGFVGRLGTFARADFAEHYPGVPVVDGIEQLPSLIEAAWDAAS